MYNTNWPLNQNKSTSNVDWSALADTWMQQREQQVQWQQAPPPLPPVPPPPHHQFLIGAPPIPPPGPMPIGMTFPPLPPTQLSIGQHHHQLQVGSNTTQESLTMTNIENAHWRPPLPPPPPPPPPSLMMPGGPQWRPNMNNNQQPLFPIQSEIAPSFGGRNFWPPSNTGQQPIPPPIPPPVPPPPLPPVPPQPSQIPSQFSAASYQHSPVDKRMLNTSFNTSIPSLMELPSSYKQNPVPPPMPIPPVSVLPMDSVIASNVPNVGAGSASAKRRKIPAWLREELGRIEKQKEKKIQNTSANSSNNNNHSTNNSSSKFDDDDDDEEEEEAHESRTGFNDDDDDDDVDAEGNEQDDDEEPNAAQISSTPIATRRSRFDDDKPTDPQLNVSAISKRTHPTSPSPPPTSNTLIEDDPIDKEEQFMNKLRRALTELLLEVTNEELASIAKDVYLSCKAESSTPVIRKASGLSSLIQSFSGTDSDDEEEKSIQTIVKTSVITKTPIQSSSIKSDNDKSISKSSTKTSDDDTKSTKTKKKKSTRDRTPTKKHHQKKHRHHSSSSSSSSSNSSQKRSQKKKKSSDHTSYSDHKKYDDRGRKH